MDWILLAEFRVWWLTFVNMAMNIWMPHKLEKFAEWLAERLRDSQGLCSMELGS
jgi:hypothetical protein